MMAPKSDFLLNLLATPTAPFRETRVAQLLMREAKKFSIPCYQDKIGNLFLGVRSEGDLKRIIAERSKKPVALFIAHMDHPGFHVTQAGRKVGEFVIKWHGGGPTKDLNGATLYVANAEGLHCEAELVSARLHRSGDWMLGGRIQVKNPDLVKGLDPKSLYGSWHFSKSVWTSKNNYYCTGADDLAGCYAILKAMQHNKRVNSKLIPLALFSVGEEVGWVGAIGHFMGGLWNRAARPVYAVSVEASRQLDRARIGAGPVIRLGDKASVFHPRMSQQLLQLSCRVLKGKYQFRVMNGGTCEGSVSTAWNLNTVGLCVPLGNYHNQCIEGGPRSSKIKKGPAPEFINKNDLDGLVKICTHLMKTPLFAESGDPFKEKRSKLIETYAEFKGELR